ncbi:MAG: hypothetical protein NTAFB01_30690 [Nitrospira sp.]
MQLSEHGCNGGETQLTAGDTYGAQCEPMSTKISLNSKQDTQTAAELARPTQARPLRRLIKASRNAFLHGQGRSEVREVTNREPHVFGRAQGSPRTDKVRRVCEHRRDGDAAVSHENEADCRFQLLLDSPGMLSKQ